MNSPRSPSRLRLAYSIKEACELLRVSRSTLYALMNSGDLAYCMVLSHRRIPHDSLVSLLAKRQGV
jgi:excisionase family DNA binding protein